MARVRGKAIGCRLGAGSELLTGCFQIVQGENVEK